jgi:acyl-coenzyme A synthetase/AMP-(fatty) acid ligase
MNAAAALLSVGESARPALDCAGLEMSYAQLADSVARAAGRLRALGVEPGDRVLLAADDSIDWVVAHLGTIWAGGVSVPLNPRLQPELLAQIARDSGARLLIGDRPADAGIPRIGCDGFARGAPVDAWHCTPETPAFWVYSSGTTAQPKAVVHAHRALAGCAAFAREVLRVGPADRLHASSKLFFAYPLANSLYAGLGLGACVVLDPRWPDAAHTPAVAVERRATVLFAVPTLYHAMLQQGQAARLRGTPLARYVSAGESLPDAVFAGWRSATGCDIVGGYGMSETLALVLYRDGLEAPCGRPAPRTEVRVEAGQQDGAPSRLWFRHPSVALGYHRRPELERENFRDGWCSAGDLFHLSGVDRYRFAGRADDWVKVAGRWVSILELEAQLAPHCRDGIGEFAAAAVPGPEGLCGIAIFAVAAGAGRAAAERALQQAVARLPTHQRPRWVHWVDQLPRTASGKLARAALQTLHRQGAAAGYQEEGR